MYLILKGRENRVPCASCRKLQVAKTKRDLRGVLCGACKRSFVAESVRRYRDLVVSGIPRGLRYVDVQVDYIRFFDAEWDKLLRSSIEAIDGERGRPIAV